ncbi:MAG: hypothetical protein KJP16_05325 [Gammaproteobacteria bacterium]|nr:hypothetical protein [Gammaproteobacteria bacterium]NNC56849.1 hypothetical protein [Woeseiaceae bacterium]NNL50220.1 hypothetical protein [Woeseiaceae bacterium]
MSQWTILLMSVLVAANLGGCATQPRPPVDEAINDFIAVSELEEVDIVRTRAQFNHAYLTDNYVILNAGRDKYLVQFVRRCRELNEINVTPDIRHAAGTLRSRFDTIRGCRIARMFSLDETQAQELRDLGETPGTSFN